MDDPVPERVDGKLGILRKSSLVREPWFCLSRLVNRAYRRSICCLVKPVSAVISLISSCSCSCERELPISRKLQAGVKFFFQKRNLGGCCLDAGGPTTGTSCLRAGRWP